MTTVIVDRNIFLREKDLNPQKINKHWRSTVQQRQITNFRSLNN